MTLSRMLQRTTVNTFLWLYMNFNLQIRYNFKSDLTEN